MKSRNVFALLFVLVFVATSTASAREPPPANVASDSVVPSAAPATKALRVAVSPIAGYVQKDGNGNPEGFTIDLLKALETSLGRSIEFQWTANVTQTLLALERGVVDVGAGAISVTAQRERRIDFTRAYATAGLAMVVRSQPKSWWGRLGQSMTRARMTIILSFFLLIVVAGHLVWLAERGKDAFTDAYFPGVFEGMYWAIVTASTVGYGDKAPVKWAGRALAGLVIVISLPMFAIFTAELTSALTASELEGQLSSPNDLGKRNVAVIAGTTSATFARRRGLSVKSYKNVDAAVAAVADRSADAAIYDEGPLRILVRKGRKTRRTALRVIDETFDSAPIAFALPTGSSLTEIFNVALLEKAESGEIDRMQARWLRGD